MADSTLDYTGEEPAKTGKGHGVGSLGPSDSSDSGSDIVGAPGLIWAMIVLTIPIVYPIIIALGFDPIWFGVILVIVVQMGLIAPPVGLNVFVVRSVVPEVPLLTIYRGVMPFLLAMMVALLLIIIFPQIALMIPNSMFGS